MKYERFISHIFKNMIKKPSIGITVADKAEVTESIFTSGLQRGA